MSTLSRPAILPLTIARAINAGQRAYDNAPLGATIEGKLTLALARLDKVAGSTYTQGKGKAKQTLGTAKAIVGAALGRKPADLPVDVKKSGNLADDMIATLAVKEWAELTHAKATLDAINAK